MYHFAAASGIGAVEGRDGINSLGNLITLGGLTLPNLEDYEQLYPVRFNRQEFRCDSAGPGRFRGGTGCDYEVEVFTPADYAYMIVGVPERSASFGVGLGKPGSVPELTVLLPDGTKIQPLNCEVERHGPATYQALAGGGGGFGDPKTRDPSRVLRDVRDGVVSVGAAERDYAVAITSDGCSIDQAKTSRLRSA